MYQTEHWPDVLKLAARRPGRTGVSSTVVLLGLTSFFTDISSEMVSTILPIYLVYALHLSPLHFGVVDGLYQGVSALVRIAAGYSADRWGRYKHVAGFGYGLSAVCKLGLLAAGGVWTVLVAVIVADRIGKGVRTAPRDAMISLSTPEGRLATAFGVHRALDTAGAMLGPLLAFGILAAIPNGYDVVFVCSFSVAVLGLGILTFYVPNPGQATRVSAPRPSLGEAASVINTPRFRSMIAAAAMISLVTMSDGFVFLALQRRLDVPASAFPLMYVASALAYLLVAVPIGRLADRVGRVRILVAGYAMLLGVYAALLVPAEGPLILVGCLLLVGVSAASTDGVLAALASARLPQSARATGLAVLATTTGLGRLVGSILFGALWTVAGFELTVGLFFVALLVASGLCWLILAGSEGAVQRDQTAA